MLDLSQRDILSFLKNTSICYLMARLNIVIYLCIIILLLHSRVRPWGSEIIVVRSAQQKISKLVHSIQILNLNCSLLFIHVSSFFIRFFILLVRGVWSRTAVLVYAILPPSSLAPSSSLLLPLKVCAPLFTGGLPVLPSVTAGGILRWVLLVMPV